MSPMIEINRECYGWVVLGSFIYAAGGWRSKDRDQPLRSAERFDMEKQRWEELPSMEEAEGFCQGLAMNGKFYVMGSFRIISDNGYGHGRGVAMLQCFDPKTGRWSLLEKLYINNDIYYQSPVVAVVGNKLYVSQKGQNSVWKYDEMSKNVWREALFFDQSISGMACVREQLWVMLMWKWSSTKRPTWVELNMAINPKAGNEHVRHSLSCDFNTAFPKIPVDIGFQFLFLIRKSTHLVTWRVEPV